jgi:hypothetical protein
MVTEPFNNPHVHTTALLASALAFSHTHPTMSRASCREYPIAIGDRTPPATQIHHHPLELHPSRQNDPSMVLRYADSTYRPKSGEDETQPSDSQTKNDTCVTVAYFSEYGVFRKWANLFPFLQGYRTGQLPLDMANSAQMTPSLLANPVASPKNDPGGDKIARL